MENKQRVGGVRVDPAVLEWQKRAATNQAALTKKQRRDRARIVAKYDLPEWLKRRVTEEAKRVGTSASQMAGFLLVIGLERLGDEDVKERLWKAKRPSRTLRFDWVLVLEDVGDGGDVG